MNNYQTIINGENIKNSYERIVNISSTSSNSSTTTSTSTKPRKINTKETIAFDKKAYFKAALQDNVNYLECINFIGNDINSLDQFGWSALMIASCEGSIRAVKFLLEQQADQSIVDKSGRTAKSLAESKNRLGIVKLFNEKHQLNPRQTPTKYDKPCKKISFYCETCKNKFTDTTKATHENSILHRFNQKNYHPLSKRYHIPDSNVGFQMMVKQGWDREVGLGPKDKEGQLYPVKTTIRNKRSGLGVKQDKPSRITHFTAFDRDAVQWKPPKPKDKTKKDLLRDMDRYNNKPVVKNFLADFRSS